jgi:hypothetical protein
MQSISAVARPLLRDRVAIMCGDCEFRQSRDRVFTRIDPLRELILSSSNAVAGAC